MSFVGRGIWRRCTPWMGQGLVLWQARRSRERLRRSRLGFRGVLLLRHLRRHQRWDGLTTWVVTTRRMIAAPFRIKRRISVRIRLARARPSVKATATLESSIRVSVTAGTASMPIRSSKPRSRAVRCPALGTRCRIVVVRISSMFTSPT